jgi:hypothetical protein
MAEQLTHWKKNNDPRYVSGEDLKDGESIGKGLRPEMLVTISHFEDTETFDQTKQAKVVKTGFWLKEYPSGKPVYKPVILNNTNAAFCIKEFASQFMEHWLNKPLILWAQPDKRHGHVARFKKYYPPAQVSDTSAIAKLNAAEKTSEALNAVWGELSAEEKKLPSVLAVVNKLKGELK